MKLIDKILLSTDFSESAEDALQAALYLAKTYQAELLVLHVIADFQAAVAELPESVRGVVTGQLQEIEDRCAREGVQAGQMLLETGNPFEHIVQQADFHDVNMIVMGAKGIENEAGHRVGITAQKVMRKARKPVWTVKQGMGMPIKRIVCAVDFSDPARHALGNAVHLARNLGAELSVLHVIQPLSGLGVGMGKTAEKTKVEYEEKEREKFEACFKDIDIHGITCNKEIRQGKPHQEILQLTNQLRADLLVMGSEGRTGMARFLMGSVAEKVVREMPCSVMMVKGEDAIRLRVDMKVAEVEERFKIGKALLEEGFPAEAMRQFDYCLSQDMMFLPAWEGMAESQKHLGKDLLAEEYRRQAQYVKEKNWERKVEAEIRGEMWGRKVRKG